MNDLELMYLLEEEGYEPNLKNLLILKEELEKTPAERTRDMLKKARESVGTGVRETPEEKRKKAQEIIKRRKLLQETSKAQLKKARDIIQNGNSTPRETSWAVAALGKHQAGKTAAGTVKRFDRTYSDLLDAQKQSSIRQNDPSAQRRLQLSQKLHKEAEQDAIEAISDGMEYGKAAKENK